MASHSLGRLILHQVGIEARLLDDGQARLVGVAVNQSLAPPLYHLHKLRQFGDGALAQVRTKAQRVGQHGVEARLVLVGGGLHLVHGGFANASGGVVDDALQGLLVVGVNHQAQVGDDVLNLLALVEGEAAVDAVGHTGLAEVLLEDAALGVGAVEDGKVGIPHLLPAVHGGNLVAHPSGLVGIAVGLLHGDGVARLIFREDLLLYLPAVLGDEAVSSRHDSLRRAVVLLQFEEAC